MTNETLQAPVNARGHRVLAHLCADFERALINGGIDEANARGCIRVLLGRAHFAVAKEAADQAEALRDAAVLLERVLAR